jgi:hypothetical protein
MFSPFVWSERTSSVQCTATQTPSRHVNCDTPMKPSHLVRYLFTWGRGPCRTGSDSHSLVTLFIILTFLCLLHRKIKIKIQNSITGIYFLDLIHRHCVFFSKQLRFNVTCHYGWETWSFILRKEYRLNLFENKVLRKTLSRLETLQNEIFIILLFTCYF